MGYTCQNQLNNSMLSHNKLITARFAGTSYDAVMIQ